MVQGRGSGARRWVGFILVGVLLAGLGSTALPQEARAEQTLRRVKWVLGLKDPAMRNADGAEALLQRLRARLLAAHLSEFDLRIDRKHSEVSLEVTTDLDEATLRRLLLSRGEVAVWAATGGVETLADLRDLLPEGVEIVYGRQDGRLDVHLTSADREALERFAGKLSLADHQVFVGPTRPGDPTTPYRTWLVERDAAPLGLDGLGAVQLRAGLHPAYYGVQAFWGDAPQARPGGPLAGGAGLLALTEAAAPGTLLFVVDGAIEATLRVVQPVDDGRLTLRPAGVTPEEQRAGARLLAGWLAAAPHPCDVVVVFEKK